MPHRSEHAEFVDAGIYRVIRHPMYAALITTSIGWVVVTTSVPAAVASAALAVWLDLKWRREDPWLRDRYPSTRRTDAARTGSSPAPTDRGRS